jgi:hypothetical protein
MYAVVFVGMQAYDRTMLLQSAAACTALAGLAQPFLWKMKTSLG